MKKEVQKVKNGVHFKYPEFNQLYDKARQFINENVGRLCSVESIEENGKVGECIIWCGTYKIEVFSKECWRFSVKNWKTKNWDILTSEQEEDLLKFNISLNLLPIKPKSKEIEKLESFNFVEKGLSCILNEVDPVFCNSKKLQELIEKILKEQGIEKPINPSVNDSKTKFVFPLSKEIVEQQIKDKKDFDDYYAKYEEVMKSWIVMYHILIRKIAGKYPSRKDKNLSGVEKAKRSFIKNIWNLIREDKFLLNLTSTIYWRSDVSFKNLIQVALHREKVVEIAHHHRSLLPLLPYIPTQFWDWDKIGSVEKLANCLLKIQHQKPLNYLSNTIWVNKKEDANLYSNWFFNNSVSINYYWISITACNKKAMEWNEKWKEVEIPLWLRTHLLRHWHDLNVSPSSFEFSVNKKIKKDIQYSDEWLQNWSKSIHVIIQHYKKNKAFHEIQKLSNDFIGIVIHLFNGKDHCGNDLSSMSSDLKSVFPQEHPWSPILLKNFLDEEISQSQKQIAISKPKNRL